MIDPRWQQLFGNITASIIYRSINISVNLLNTFYLIEKLFIAIIINISFELNVLRQHNP